MKRQSFIYAAALVLALSSTVFVACKYDTRELGAKPTASFTMTPIAGMTNKWLLTNTSTNSFRQDWDKGTGTYVNGKKVDTLYFADAGTYNIRLLTYGHSGIDSAKQTLTVTADDPAAVTPLKILTGNSSRTWILEQPGGGALLVGDNGGGTWWTNSAADVTAADRVCLFNDEYTFTKTGNPTSGTFVFNDKGDMRVDDEGGNPWPTDIGLAIGCYPTTSIPAQYRAWGSGNFTFSIVDNNKLRVIGTGAHMGLYKVGENGTTASPDPQVTYDIVELTPTRMVLRKQYSWGQWRFTFKVKP